MINKEIFDSYADNKINTYYVHSMSSMFFNNKNVEHSISGWDVSNISNMDYMFYPSSFNNNISEWKVCIVSNNYIDLVI